MRRLIPTALLALALASYTGLGYQPAPGGDAADKVGPPAPKAGAIFTTANVITISGPMAGGKTITVEGLPVGTTKWMGENPFTGAPKVDLVGPPAPAGLDPATEARLKALEAQQAQILQVVLDLQKQLGKIPVPK